MEKLLRAMKETMKRLERIANQAEQIEAVLRAQERQMAEADGLDYTEDEIEERVQAQMRSHDFEGLAAAEIDRLVKVVGEYA